LRFETVVFADTTNLAALSCFERLRMEREAGRQTLVVSLLDNSGAEILARRGLAEARPFGEVASEDTAERAHASWRERIAVMVKRLGPRHVLAPLGLFGAPQSIDFFAVLRAALSVHSGRDLLFFEERPHCLLPEAVSLRLAGKGVRLPPVSFLKAPRGYPKFLLRMTAGWGVPPCFGGLKARIAAARAAKGLFREAADWDPHKALGPKLQPVVENWREGAPEAFLELAAELGIDSELAPLRSLRRRMARHALSSGSPTPLERYWLSLPDPNEGDAVGEV